MELQPARIEQVRQTEDGDFIIIGADANSAVADLQAIDKNLQVRLAGLKTSRPHFVVYHVHQENDVTTHSLVTTAQAYQNRLGVWEGLDQRVVERIRKINPENGYDYVAELEKREAQRQKDKKRRDEEVFGPIGEKAAWALRKDLNRQNRRAFIRTGLPKGT